MKKALLERLTLSGRAAEALFHRRKTVFEFKPGVNVLAGPNGSGKSTILKLIFPGGKASLGDATSIERAVHLDGFRKRIKAKDRVLVRQFDFEMNNPRLVRSLGMMETHDFALFGAGQRLRRLSHGEAMRQLFEQLLTKPGRCIVLLDEPEQALDFPGLGTLRALLKKASRWTQFVVASHAPVLMLEPSFNVIELEEGYVQGVRETLDLLLKGTFDAQDPEPRGDSPVGSDDGEGPHQATRGVRPRPSRRVRVPVRRPRS